MAPLRAQHGAGRELVAGRDHDGARAGAVERRDVQAVVVDRHADRVEAGPRGRVPVIGQRRVLEGDAPLPAGGERAAEQRDRLGVAGADHDRVGRRGRAAGAAEVAGERHPQRAGPAAVAVVQGRVGRGRGRMGHRPGPQPAGEERDVGRRRREVGQDGTALRGRVGRHLHAGRGGRRPCRPRGARSAIPRRSAARRRRTRRRARRRAAPRARARRAAGRRSADAPPGSRRAAPRRAGAAAAPRRRAGARRGAR